MPHQVAFQIYGEFPQCENSPPIQYSGTFNNSLITSRTSILGDRFGGILSTYFLIGAIFLGYSVTCSRPQPRTPMIGTEHTAPAPLVSPFIYVFIPPFPIDSPKRLGKAYPPKVCTILLLRELKCKTLHLFKLKLSCHEYYDYPFKFQENISSKFVEYFFFFFLKQHLRRYKIWMIVYFCKRKKRKRIKIG